MMTSRPLSWRLAASLSKSLVCLTGTGVLSLVTSLHALAPVVQDVDGDGLAEAFDLDDDNDGLADSSESAVPFRFETAPLEVPGEGGSITQDVDLSSYGVELGDSVTISHVVALGDLNSSAETFSFSFNDGEANIGGLQSGNQCSSTLDPVTPAVNQSISVIDLGAGVLGVRIECTSTPQINFCNVELEYALTISGTGIGMPNEDGDAVQDSLDVDSDNDGVLDITELGLTDADGDGLVDLQSDSGSLSSAPDSDGDGLPDYLDLESNNAQNDGTAYDIAGSGFAAFDTNGDGRIDALDAGGGVDADLDGIDDLIDRDPTRFGNPEPDCDMDGVPDSADTDPDCNGNGIQDNCESFSDCNGNQIPDECDPDCNGNGIPDDCADPCDPTANFSFSPSGGVVPVTVTFTDLSTNDPTSWAWNFGDGSTSSAQNPVHTYTESGTFTVSLTVANASGSDTLTMSGAIVVDPDVPVADFSFSPTSGVVPLTVSFTDQSQNVPTSWAWDFGDGSTSNLQSPTHTYTESGSYTVSLTVSNAAGTDSHTITGAIQVNPDVPVADFSFSASNGVVPLAVSFTDQSQNVPTSWAWDFGDGSTSNLQNPAHTYTESGTYTVSLTVSNAAGSDTHTITDAIQVNPDVPVADFSFSASSGVLPFAVSFTDLSQNVPTSWAWDFGDGNTSDVASPVHTYTSVGIFTVSLTVSNAAGNDTLTLVDVIVVDPEAPTAAFAADVTTIDPEGTVQFTDLSTSDPTSWSWDFGDGNVSTAENPSNQYLLPGFYTVSLTVTNVTGSDTATIVDYITVDSYRLGFLDGSFENSTPGQAPGAPWELFSGTTASVQSIAPYGDAYFPTDGDHWLAISAAGTNNVSPPAPPGGLVFPSIGGATARQGFRFDPDVAPFLELNAAFVLNGFTGDSSFNDWMSVEVTDGISHYNLFFADSFSEFPRSSAATGLVVTDVEAISVDLRTLFPTADETVELFLEVIVANRGDDENDSIGYVDDVRLSVENAANFEVLGCGANPLGSMRVAGKPAFGQTATLRLDNPLGTTCPGSTIALVYLSNQSAPGLPCGFPFASYGLAGGASELFLIPGLGFLTSFVGSPWAGPGAPSEVPLMASFDASLVGADFFAQGVFIDLSGACGTTIGLTDGARLIVGF